MIIKLAPNVPQRLAIKYVDAVPPNDPKYGPQARLKTESNDLLYLPGKATDAFSEMFRAGIIAEIPQTLPTVPGEQMVSVKLRQGVKQVLVNVELAAGEKHGKLRVLRDDGTQQPAAAPEAAQSYAPAPQPSPYRETQTETGAAPAAAAPVDSRSGSAVRRAVYLELVEFVTRDVVPRIQNGAGLRMSPESIVAAVATLYIQEMK